jgi:hypothetical protein
VVRTHLRPRRFPQLDGLFENTNRRPGNHSREPPVHAPDERRRAQPGVPVMLSDRGSSGQRARSAELDGDCKRGNSPRRTQIWWTWASQQHTANTRSCRIERVIDVHIYAPIGMLTHASTNAASFRYVPGCFTTRRRRRSPMQEYGARRRGVRAVQGVLRGAGAVAGRRGGREPAARGPGRAVANARPGAAASAAPGPPDLWRCGAVSAASAPYCVPIRLVKIGANAATPDRRTPPGGRAGSCGVAGSQFLGAQGPCI